MDEDELCQIIAEKDDEIAALFERVAELESAARRLSEWQPIETAPDKPESCANGCPKNQVCDFCQNMIFFIGWDGCWPEIWSAKQYRLSLAEKASPALPIDDAKSLTHWMPLPDPPKLQKPVREPMRMAIGGKGFP